MSAIAVERPRERAGATARRGASRVLLFLVVLGAIWALWEGYRWLWEREGWTWPFVVDDTTMPHLHDIFAALWAPARPGGVGPRLISILVDGALFTAKEAAVGFALGATIGFVLGAILARFILLQRGLLPWVVASQTVPILVVAPMVVVWANPKLPDNLKDWGAVSLIAAYLTFFPVTVNTLLGLETVDSKQVALMRSFGASNHQLLWRVQLPTALPQIFVALRLASSLSLVGAIVGEWFGDTTGLGVLLLQAMFTENVVAIWGALLASALLGTSFYAVVAAAERRLVFWSTEQ